MTEYLEILRLASLGVSNSKIAVGACCSRQTVISVLKKAAQKSISYEDAKGMAKKELAAAINEGGLERARYRKPDFEYIHKELGKSGVTLSLLWIEYCKECKRTGEIPYQSTQFNKHYRDYAVRTGATMHIERTPGESMEVDWIGGSVGVWDEASGAELEAYVFVSVLSYSGYAYAEAFWTMKMDDWLVAHVHAYEFFGGVARLLVPDNLKTGVDKNTRTETLVNKTYMELADHYGAAVLPARVYKPNDKPGVEGAIKGIKTWVLAAVRNETFTTLFDLNAVVREKIDEYNAKPFQKMPGSRLGRYLDEKVLLLPLPKWRYERSDWVTAKVQKDYHIKCGEKYYSVPFAYIGCTVNARVTRDMVEIFHEGQRICSHQRSVAGKYVTEKEHMPAGHRKHGEWSGERFRMWAGKIGPSTLRCIEHYLGSAKVEQQSYKTCNALLHLSDRFSPARLENACTLALSFSPRPSYKAVSSILKAEKDLDAAKESPDKRTQDDEAEKHGFIRGAEYYGKKDGGYDDDE